MEETRFKYNININKIMKKKAILIILFLPYFFLDALLLIPMNNISFKHFGNINCPKYEIFIAFLQCF